MVWTKEKQRAYYIKNREEVRRRAYEGLRANNGEGLTTMREYYHKNREKIREQNHQLITGHNGLQVKRNRLKVIKCKYGLSEDEAFTILAKPCAICGTSEGTLHIDHNHTTGKVRDRLCSRCNQSIGLMDESPEKIRKSAEYLELHNQIFTGKNL